MTTIPAVRVLRTQTVLDLKVSSCPSASHDPVDSSTPSTTHDTCHTHAQNLILTSPAAAHARRLAEAGDLLAGVGVVNGLAADGTPLGPTLAEQGVTAGRLRLMQLGSQRIPREVLRGDKTKLQRTGKSSVVVVEVRGSGQVGQRATGTH